MRTVCVTLFVVVVALGLSACLGQDWDDLYDDDNFYGVPFSSGYSMGYGGGSGGGYVVGNGGGYGGGYGKGYGRVESTVIRTPYAAPMFMPPPPAMPVGGFGGQSLFGENNGLIFLLLLLPFLLSNSNGGLLG